MLRRANPAGLEAVFDIYMDEKIIPFLGYDPMPLPEFREKVFSEMLRDPSFSVIEKDGTLVEFFKAWRHPGRAGHVACRGSFALAPK